MAPSYTKEDVEREKRAFKQLEDMLKKLCVEWKKEGVRIVYKEDLINLVEDTISTELGWHGYIGAGGSCWVDKDE